MCEGKKCGNCSEFIPIIIDTDFVIGRRLCNPPYPYGKVVLPGASCAWQFKDPNRFFPITPTKVPEKVEVLT